MNENVVFLSVKENKLQDKEHEFLPLTWAYFSSHMENGKRVISQKDFKKYLRQVLRKRGPKIDKIINAYLMLGTITEDGENYIISKTEDKFVKLTIPTAQFCIENLSELSMKVYCYLLNKQQIHDKYRYKENYFFSKSELLRAVGYSEGSKNKLKITQTLEILKNFDLINFSNESVGRPGKHGTYLELYQVNQYSIIQKEAANKFIREENVISDPFVAQQICIPGVDLEKVQLAGEAKTWLEMGAYTLDCLPQKYLEAYKNVYDD